MDDNQALLKVLLLDILPSLLDVTTDLAQAISLLVPQVCPMIIIVIKSILMKVIIVGGWKRKGRIENVRLDCAYPGLGAWTSRTGDDFIKIGFGFKLKLPIHLDCCWSKSNQVHLLAHHRPNKPSLTYFLW